MTKKIGLATDPLKEAYALLQASSPAELVQKFIKEDQRLLQAQAWDYKDPGLLVNKVKEIVERALDGGFKAENADAQDDLRDILWFWYHHAIGHAIWGYKDKTKAQEFSEKALSYQIPDNPNKITRLFYLLVHDRQEEAVTWLETITEEPDKTVAQGIMKEYANENLL